MTIENRIEKLTAAIERLSDILASGNELKAAAPVAKPAPAEAPAPVVPPVALDAPTPIPATVPATMTAEQLNAELIKVATQMGDGGNAIKALLTEHYEGKALHDIPATDYAGLLEKAKGLV